MIGVDVVYCYLIYRYVYRGIIFIGYVVYRDEVIYLSIVGLLYVFYNNIVVRCVV